MAKKTKEHIGLGYLAHMVPLCLHGGDPLAFFKVDEYSKRVRKEFEDGPIFQDMIKKYFLNNDHHLRLYLKPDSKLGEREEQEEAKNMKALNQALTKEEKETIVAEAYEF